MSTEEFLTQGRPAEVLREAILRHIRYTLVRPTSELTSADYLIPVSLAVRDRIVDIGGPLSAHGCAVPAGHRRAPGR